MKLPYWFTPLGLFNFFIAQWFLVRLQRTVDIETGETLEWSILGFVVPLTGWHTDYVYLHRGVSLLWLFALSLFIAVLFAGCTPPIPPRPPVPPKAIDACPAFCEVYVSLGCDVDGNSPGEDGHLGTIDDVACEQVCIDSVQVYNSAPDRACLDTAATCEAAEACMFGPELSGLIVRPQPLPEPRCLVTCAYHAPERFLASQGLSGAGK